MHFDLKLSAPLDAILFDCDGTLSRLEGIDELARQNGVGDIIETMTAQAMSATGVSADLYAERLALVQPSQQQVLALGQAYIDSCNPGVVSVIDALKKRGKAIYIVSAGLKPAVAIFARYLNIPESQVFAVEMDFDLDGHYLAFNQASPLVDVGGKCQIVATLKQQHARILHIGDGMNDADVKGHVTRFIGYGGVFCRESIRDRSDFYIETASLLPLLPLALTATEADQLTGAELAAYQAGLQLIEAGE